MADPHLEVPAGVEIVSGPKGLRFLGHEEPLIAICTALRGFGGGEFGPAVRVGGWTLEIGPVVRSKPNVVRYSVEAWRVAAGVLIDVPSGGYRSPLDFGDVAFVPRANPDIGVSLLGVTRYDKRRLNRPVPTNGIRAVEEAEPHFAKFKLGVLVRGDEAMSGGWVVDLVSLSDGEINEERFAAGESIEVSVARALDRLR